MSRRPAIVPATQIEISFPPDLAAKLQLYLWSEVLGKIPFGAYKAFFARLLNEFFSSQELDLSPYLGTLPGEHIVKASPHTISQLINHLKGEHSGSTETS